MKKMWKMRYTHKNSPKTNSNVGFSLIELLVSIGIVGILAAVAVPSYISFTKNGEISSALATLMNLTTQMEKRFVDLGSYNCGISIPADATYAFTCSLTDGYTLTAASTAGTSAAYQYTIIQSGARATKKFDGGTPTGNNANCWLINKSGGCF